MKIFSRQVGKIASEQYTELVFEFGLRKEANHFRWKNNSKEKFNLMDLNIQIFFFFYEFETNGSVFIKNFDQKFKV